MKQNINKDIINSGRIAWNKLTKIFHEPPQIFKTNKEFEVFYIQLLDDEFRNNKDKNKDK